MSGLYDIVGDKSDCNCTNRKNVFVGNDSNEGAIVHNCTYLTVMIVCSIHCIDSTIPSTRMSQ